MSVATTERHLLARGWKKLTPKQVLQLPERDYIIAPKVVGSMLYELQTMDGNTYMRRL
jgi:hypothetical protein